MAGFRGLLELSGVWLHAPALTAPSANFSVSTLFGTAPLTVNVVDTSSGVVVTRVWDFTDAGVTDSTAASASYTYTTSGTYTIRLTVGNSVGTSQALAVITVYAAPTPPAPTLTWRYEADWAKDGQFAHTHSDISNYVSGASWKYGMQNAFEGDGAYKSVAETSEAALRLLGRNGEFLPSGLLDSETQRGVLVRITASYDGTDYPMYTGKISAIRPGLDTQNANGVLHTAQMDITDQMDELLDAEFFPQLLTNTRIDTALTAMFDQAVVLYPYPPFVIEASALDEDALFINEFTDFEQSITTLEWIGDNSDAGKGVSAQGYVRDTVAGEIAGRFYWDAREAKFKFVNRHADVLADTAFEMTDSLISGVGAIKFEDLTNIVTLTFSPRNVGTPETQIYSYPNLPLELRAKAKKNFTARYATVEGAKVGATDVIQPVPGVDVIYTGGELIASCEIGAGSAKFTLENTHGRETATITTLKIRGTPLETFSNASVTERDATSIHEYGRLEKTLSIRAISDEDFATDVARLLKSRFATPIFRLASVMFVVNTNKPTSLDALALGVGARVRVNSASSNHNAEYIIVGQSHVVDPATAKHDVTWILKPLDRDPYFIIQNSEHGELDGNNVIAL